MKIAKITKCTRVPVGHVYGIEYMFRMLKISVDVYDLPINRLHHTFWPLLYGLKS